MYLFFEIVIGAEEWSADGILAEAEEAASVAEGNACLWRGQYYALNATWQWKCNTCACVGGRAACTRIWCGLPDCMASQARNCDPNQVKNF